MNIGFRVDSWSGSTRDFLLWLRSKTLSEYAGVSVYPCFVSNE